MADRSFLFTDVVGSTQRWEEDGVVMAIALAEHDASIEAAVAAHGGHLLKTKGEGDSTVSMFAHAASALAAAADAQRTLALPVRMAVHTGPAQERDGDFYGPTLNRAARLRAIAHGGQVVCSEAAASRAAGALADGLSLVGLGLHRLKDLVAPERVFQLTGPGLVAEFPPLASLNRTTSNLPALHSSFVGRRDELLRVRSMMATARMCTLVGTGGAGKTRLSLEVAAELFDEFPDGVWFCELAPISEDAAVANVVAGAADIALLPGDPVEQVVSSLAGKRSLLLLDNCEHVVDGAAAVASALLKAAPEVHILATSRERLRIAGESTVTVPPLALPPEGAPSASSDAVQLFLERAALADTDLEVDDATLLAATAICRRVEGVPLAIELAAARARLMGVHDLATRLQRHWDLLRGGDRDAPPHHRSLRATIDWSHSLLSSASQEAMHRLAVFRGGFRLSSAEQLLVASGHTPDDAVDALQDLLDKSLIAVDVETGRFRMLEAVREYALEHLAAQGLALETSRRHAVHFVELLREVEVRLLCVDEQRGALLLVAAEHDNIVAALTWSLEHDIDLAGQLVGWSFGPWYGLGQSEAPTWYRRLLPVIDDLEGEVAARACAAVGVVLGFLGDADTAGPLLDRAVAVARTLPDAELLAMALSLSAALRRLHGDVDAAEPMAREALSIPVTSPRRMIRAWVCSLASWVLWDAGSQKEAREAILEAHDLSLERDDHLLRASILDGVGEMAPECMGTDEVLRAIQEERSWLREAGVAEDAAATAPVGWYLLREHRWAEALENVERLLSVPQRHRRQEFDRRFLQGRLLQLLDRPDEAVAVLEELLRTVSEEADRCRVVAQLAVARRDAGDLGGSEAACAEALRYLVEGGSSTDHSASGAAEGVAASMLLLRATLLLEAGQPASAVAAVVGAAQGWVDRAGAEVDLELEQVRHGYEGTLPTPDSRARAFASRSTLPEVLAHLDDLP